MSRLDTAEGNNPRKIKKCLLNKKRSAKAKLVSLCHSILCLYELSCVMVDVVCMCVWVYMYELVII